MSIDDYNRQMDVIFQQMRDREEAELVGLCRSLPATDDEINDMREAMRHLAGRDHGLLGAKAATWADAALRKCLDYGVFGPHFKVG